MLIIINLISRDLFSLLYLSSIINSSNSIEPNKVLHICSQCNRTFKDINNFREHLFQEHGELGVNVRQCHLCSYATLLKSKYDCHIVTRQQTHFDVLI